MASVNLARACCCSAFGTTCPAAISASSATGIWHSGKPVSAKIPLAYRMSSPSGRRRRGGEEGEDVSVLSHARQFGVRRLVSRSSFSTTAPAGKRPIAATGWSEIQSGDKSPHSKVRRVVYRRLAKPTPAPTRMFTARPAVHASASVRTSRLPTASA